MEREELIKLIMKRIYTRRIYAEALADDILRLFNVVGQSEQLLCFLCKKNKVEVEDDICNECSKDFE